MKLTAVQILYCWWWQCCQHISTSQTCQIFFAIFLMKIDATEVSCSQHLFHCFSSEKKDLSFKVSLRLFEHFILQLPFKHGNSPSIPRIQARMQWCLCPLSEEQSSTFWTWWNWCENPWWNWWNPKVGKPVGPTCMFAGRFSMTTKSETNSWKG